LREVEASAAPPLPARDGGQPRLPLEVHEKRPAGRERARERFSWQHATEATLAAYADASGRMPA
jgi:hypothetical protein